MMRSRAVRILGLALSLSVLILFSGCEFIDDILPNLINDAPVVVIDETGEFEVELGEFLPIDAGGSFDEEADLLSFLWSVTDFPANATLSDFSLINPETATVEFTAQIIGTYTITVIVSDGTDEQSATVEITVTEARFDVALVVSDRDTGLPIAEGTASVVENGASNPVVDGGAGFSLPVGTFNIAIEAAGYRPNGITLPLSDDVEIAVALAPLGSAQEVTGTVSGTVTEAATPRAGAFSIAAGIPGLTELIEISNTDDSGDYEVSSAPGDIIVSAFSTDANDEIVSVSYVRDTLTAGGVVVGADIDIPSGLTTYSGTKEAVGDLTVKTGGYTLAHQPAYGTDTSYSFGIALAAGDAVTLESIFLDGSNTYFSKAGAGSSGGTTDVGFALDLPTLIQTDMSGYFSVEYPAVSNADFYEYYVVEIDSGDMTVTYQGTSVANGGLKIPDSLIDTGADSVSVYVSAVDLPGFSVDALLADTLSLATYSYSEAGVLLVDNSVSTASLGGSPQAAPSYRSATGSRYLMMEQ